jgi:hypothetical protein
MLEKVLGSQAKISILRVLASRPEGSFSLNELSRLSGCAVSTVAVQIKELVGIVVSYNDETGKYGIIRDSLLYGALDRLFSTEARMKKPENPFLFLSQVGGYFVSGSSALVLRGLSRDFTGSPRRLLLICDRTVARRRGMIMTLLLPLKALLVENEVQARDYVEMEASLGRGRVMLNVAVIERAVADALWRVEWERADLDQVVYAMMEEPLDLEVLKRYARDHGEVTESRLLWVLQTIEAMTMQRPSTRRLRAAKTPPPRWFRGTVVEAVKRVLGS